MATGSHAQRDESESRVVVSGDGVQIRKWVSLDDAPVPVVKYEIASARDDDVRIRVTDAIPEHLNPDDVGFHDDYLGDRWHRPGPRAVRFESEVRAGEELTTVYGIREDSIDEPDAYLEEPTLAVAENPEHADGGRDGDGERDADERKDGDDGRDADGRIDVDEESDGAANDSTEQGSSGEPNETLSLADPTDGAAADANPQGQHPPDAGADSSTEGATTVADRAQPGAESSMPIWDSTADAASDAARAYPSGESEGDDETQNQGDAEGSGSEDGQSVQSADGDVAGSLAAELQEGAVDEEIREMLARELNLQLSASSSQFVEHLQSRMKEKRGQLEGDIERLEDSIAELYGVKADSSVVSSVREETADASTVAEIESAIADVREAKADVDAIDAVEETISELEGDVALETDLAAATDDLRAELDDLDGRLAALDAETASEAGVEELAKGVRELDDETPTQSAFDDLRADHEDLVQDGARESDVASLRDDLEAAKQDLIDEVDAERRTRKDEQSTLASRLDDLADDAASVERVSSIEADLERRYVTADDITAALEARLARSLQARAALGGAGLAAGAGIALVATGLVAGAAFVVVGLGLLAFWWWLNDQELDVEPA